MLLAITLVCAGLAPARAQDTDTRANLRQAWVSLQQETRQQELSLNLTYLEDRDHLLTAEDARRQLDAGDGPGQPVLG